MGMGCLVVFVKDSTAGEEPGLGIFGAWPPELDDGRWNDLAPGARFRQCSAAAPGAAG